MPVFAADIPPVRESGANFTQLFNPNGNHEDVARRIDEFIKNDKAYNLRKRVRDNFTWEAVIKNDIIPLIAEAAQT
jgi:glycosyltransferase involved in cell wall biosynthesis